MKKLIILVLVAVLALGAFAGCSSKPEYKFDKESLKGAIDKIEWTDSEGNVNPLFGMSMIVEDDENYEVWMEKTIARANVEDFLIYYPAMMTRTDAMLVIKPVEDKKQDVLDGIEALIQAQKDTFSWYLPGSGNMELLEGAEIYEENGYVICLITANNAEAKKAITASFVEIEK